MSYIRTKRQSIKKEDTKTLASFMETVDAKQTAFIYIYLLTIFVYLNQR